MSTLLVDQLTGSNYIEQTFRITKSVSVSNLRPWVYLQGTFSTGTFQCRVYQGATLLKTVNITAAQLNAAKTLEYAHGYIRFDFDALALHLEEGETTTEYKFQLEMIGYTPASNFIGVCREWDLKSQILYGTGVINNQAPNDAVEPYGFQIYAYGKG